MSPSPYSSPLLLPWGPDDAGDVLIYFHHRFYYFFFSVARPTDNEMITTEKIVCYSPQVEGSQNMMQSHMEKHQGQSEGLREQCKQI